MASRRHFAKSVSGGQYIYIYLHTPFQKEFFWLKFIFIEVISNTSRFYVGSNIWSWTIMSWNILVSWMKCCITIYKSIYHANDIVEKCSLPLINSATLTTVIHSTLQYLKILQNKVPMHMKTDTNWNTSSFTAIINWNNFLICSQ